MVKIQMSVQNPQNSIDELITESLNTLTSTGVLAHTGTSEYGLRCVLQYDNVQRDLPAVPVMPIPRVTPKPPTIPRLDPNKPKTDLISKESMSGGELTKARKRWRCNNKVLPKRPCDRKKRAKPKKVKKNKPKKRDSYNLQAVTEHLNQAFEKIKRQEQREQMRLAKAVPVIQQHPLDLSNINPVPLERGPSAHPSGAAQGMPQPPDQLPAIGNTLWSPVDCFDGPNTDNASMLGLCGSRIRAANPFQRRWAPFWERAAGNRVNVDGQQGENRPAWVRMSLPNLDLFGNPYN
ncbi:uncharacterized protein Dwil_GK27646 [Drosophila willistoni]|uniref:Uncharacterized protein n=1 Tax=Drosophila willistoni TaxID=7260 RepID=A0A0Q9X625_DROWI|nr:uncharacterized protein Dwil_GK27646 [Drosophila willistoni]